VFYVPCHSMAIWVRPVISAVTSLVILVRQAQPWHFVADVLSGGILAERGPTWECQRFG